MLHFFFRSARAHVPLALILVIGITEAAWAAWDPNGNPMSIAVGDQVNARIVSDEVSGGAIVVWQDFRNGTDYDLYATRVNALGFPFWTPDGSPVCTETGYQTNPDAISDGAGGAFVVWEDGRTDTLDVYVQHIDGFGNRLWGPGGVPVCTFKNNQTDPRLISDGAGGVIVTWFDRRVISADVYAQRVNAAGSPVWTPNGVLVCVAASNFIQSDPVLASDGASGAIIVWRDSGTVPPTIRSQHVDASGALLWNSRGVTLCSLGGLSPQVISDGAGGAIVAWTDFRISTNGDVYAQRVDGTGNVLWTTDGAAVCLATREQADVRLMPDGAGGAVFAWEDLRTVGGIDIYAQRVNAVGSMLWTPDGVAISTAAGTQNDPYLAGDGSGGAVICWFDQRGGLNNFDIYAQHVNGAGVPTCTVNGVAVCTASGNQLLPRIAAATGGAIVAWHDKRSGVNDLYAGFVGLCSNPVPVLFLHFNATAKSDAMVLEWTVSNDEPFQGFRIYRSGSSGGFLQIGDLPVDATSYRDASVTPGANYRYMITAVGADGDEMVSPIVAVNVASAALVLHANRPNPFNPATTIAFTLPRAMDARIEIFDVAGHLVTTLQARGATAGHNELQWDGTNANGEPVSSGTYLYRLKVGNQVLTRKMTLLK